MTKIDNFTEEEFLKIVKESTTYSEISQKLGYSKNSTATKQIKDKCKERNISLEHLQGTSKIIRKLSPEIIFIENSDVSQHSLREWYFKESYSDYKCSICGQEPFWNNKPLTLTLDHINGINNDNRLQNLRWVCPNCNRQLPTFGSKNKNGKEKYNKLEKNYCIDCGKKISYSATRCSICKGIDGRKVERPTKENLEKILKDNNGNFSATGKLFNVTDNTIRKQCKGYGMPGYSKDYKQN